MNGRAAGRSETPRTLSGRVASYANRHDGGALIVRSRHRPAYFVTIEVVAAALGFAGLGWLSSGRALLGVGLLIASPIVVWVLIPIAMSLVQVDTFTPAGPWPMLAYLAVSACVSGSFLAWDLRSTKGAEASA